MKVTESTSLYDNLEEMTVSDLLDRINLEDQKVAISVKNSIQTIKNLVDQIILRMRRGGRLIYIGAGTSGRLGVLDASECPPTFGVPHDMILGLIAGGDLAIRKAVENAEDDANQAWKDILTHGFNALDTVVGIAASGSTPYVLGGVILAKTNGLMTGCITCNPKSALALAVDFPIEVVVGPEFVTGSTRMKAGTAQKLVLNMISTSVMIKLGKVKGNKMVDMQLSNVKLIQRGVDMIREATGLDQKTAETSLRSEGSVRKAIEHYYRTKA